MKQKIAQSISLTFNPFILLATTILAALLTTPFPSRISQEKWFTMVLLINFILPYFWISFLDNRGFILDDTLQNKRLHRKRIIALMPILVTLIGEIIVIYSVHIYQPFLAVLVSMLIIICIGGIISYYWKISAHMLGLTTTVTLFAILFGSWIWWSALFIPIVMGARLALHRHTFLQLLIGALIPPCIVYLVFYFYHLI